ncbi:MAG: flagellar biosynthesis protein FlhF [Phycisphaerae bacterium]|nr:flagellar biosynthesis protein FlhF [Phycisphaerae bacterium]
MAEVLEKVKGSLGADAVILHTRTLRKGGLLGLGARTIVEITASRDVSALNPAERRAIIGRRTERPGGERSTRVNAGRPAIRMPQAEGAPVRPSGDADSTVSNQLAAFSSSLRGEMGELREMVRQLLDRAPSASPAPTGDVPQELREYYSGLLQNEVAEEIAREVIAEARVRLAECRDYLTMAGEGTQDADARHRLKTLIPQVMVETIERMIPSCEPLQLADSGRTRFVALVGPTGVGKTTTIAKLAAHFKLREGRRVGLITIDTYRIAAVDQIQAYADILNIPLEVVMTPEGMVEAIANLTGCDLVLIDTSGRSQRDVQRLDDLKEFLDLARRVAGPSRTSSESPGESPLEVHLVLSCTAHPSQLIEVAEKFSPLGVDRVVFTKLDEALGLGVILNVIRRLNLKLSYLTTGQDVPDDIEVGHCRRIAELILGRGDSSSGPVGPAPAGRRLIDHVA